ncbi:MAG: hypothetical protein IJY73_06280 [Oscillospiraceae bacterium]|nr:hypothetical protein [Oscillospiraceae bacterium]
MRFVREKAVKSAERYKDVNIYQLTTEQDTFSRKRVRKKLSTPKQVKQDWKYARQYATQLVNANFSEGDYILTLTYDEEPESREDAERDVANFVARVKTLYRRLGLSFRAFWATGGGHPRKKGGGVTRFHHHLIISGGADRDWVEAAWNYRDINRLPLDTSKKELDYLVSTRGAGNRVESSRAKIKKTEFGLEPIVKYMVKPGHCSSKPNAKRWHSCGLSKKPVETRSDTRYSEKDLHKLVKLIREGQAQAYIERQYKGWELLEIEDKISSVTGQPYLRLKLRKKNAP